MAKTESKEGFWEKLFLSITAVIVTAITGAIISHYWPIEKDHHQKIPPVFNNQTTYTNTTETKDHSNHPPLKHLKPVRPEPAHTYVEVFLNINSNDKILVNGSPPQPEEISEKQHTLKLISGKRYVIKINNCPEKEILAEQGMTISTCM